MKLIVLRIEKEIVIAALQFWCKIVQPGGGKKCLFTIISYLVHDGDVTKAEKVRAEIVALVVKNWSVLKNFTDDKYSVGGSFRSKRHYAEEMSKPHTEGTICELLAAGALYPYQFVLIRKKQVKLIVGEKERADIKILSLDGDQFNVFIPFQKQNLGNV